MCGDCIRITETPESAPHGVLKIHCSHFAYALLKYERHNGYMLCHGQKPSQPIPCQGVTNLYVLTLVWECAAQLILFVALSG